MKRLTSFICSIAIVASAVAQTLNVAVDNILYQFPASQTGAMPYTDGTTLTIMGKEFSVSDIDNMYIDNTAVTDNSVNVVFSQSDVAITVAGNIAQYVDFSYSGAHLSIAQSESVDETVGEITYSLSGSSTDGELYMTGTYKCEVDLNGLTLTNTNPVYSGAPINIQNGKRIKISVKKGTTNTITDVADGGQKACLVVKGHPEFKGQGTLNIYANEKHGIKASDYMEMKNCTINILSAVSDGIQANEYFLIESGTLNISGTGDDGLQVELSSETSTGDKSLVNSDGSHEDEDSGNIYIQGGTINVKVTATAAKGIKCDGDMNISGGTITVETSGNGTYEASDETTFDTKAASCLSADGDMTISGGTITLSSSGSGGKGAKCDGALTISGGDITITTTGGMYFYDGTNESHDSKINTDNYESNYYSSPKGIKAGGNVDITGGTFNVSTSGNNGEGIESKNIMTITDGIITLNTYDDALNSSSHMYIKGGYIYAYATNNDAIDANGNLYMQGGFVYAITGANGGEKALDANTEDQYKLYIQGGTMIAISDIENGAQMTQACYQIGGSSQGGPGGMGQQQQQSQSSSYKTNTWYALYSGGTLVAAFKTPSAGSNIIVSTASTPSLMTSATNNQMTISGGTEYFGGTVLFDATVSGGSSVTLNQYSSNQGGPGGR